MTSNLTTPGVAVVTVGGTVAAPAGPLDLVLLEAAIPADATYGAAQLLRLDSVRVNEGLVPVWADDGLHKVVYLGDASGNSRYLGLDPSLIARVVVGLDSGFETLAGTDPRIIADVTGDGTLSALDWSYVAQKTVGLPRPEIPDLPANLPPVASGGLDPTLAIPVGVTARPGDAVLVPVSIIDSGAGLMSALVVIDYDTSRLDVGDVDVALGTLVSGLTGNAAWTLTKNVDHAAGRITVLANSAVPLGSGPGELLQVTYHVRPEAAAGTIPLYLMQSRNYLNEDRLTVSTVDGSLVIELPETQTLIVTQFVSTDTGFVASFGRTIDAAATNVGAFDFDLFFDPSRLTIQVPSGVSAGADTAGWAMSAVLVAPGQLRVGMVSSNGQPLATGLREIARLQFRAAAGESSRTGWHRLPVTDHRLPITDVSDGSEIHPTWLDIEPVDARAGGYAWTAVDGSLLIRPEYRLSADQETDVFSFDDVLSDLAGDIASAWSRGQPESD